MTDKEKIKNWVKNLKSQAHTIPSLGINSLAGFQLACDDVIAFINSLPEEPASEDLEEEIKNYIQKEYPDGMGFPNVPKIARHFAEWQKQQMMKNAVEAIVHQGLYSKYVKESDDEALANALKNYNSGDKVKIIIVKTEQQ